MFRPVFPRPKYQVSLTHQKYPEPIKVLTTARKLDSKYFHPHVFISVSTGSVRLDILFCVFSFLKTLVSLRHY